MAVPIAGGIACVPLLVILDDLKILDDYGREILAAGCLIFLPYLAHHAWREYGDRWRQRRP